MRGQPSERGAETRVPRSRVMRSSRTAGDPEFPAILPSLAPKDSTEISMIRLITFVQTDRAVVEVEPRISWKNRPFLQTLQNRRMQGRGSLDSFEGSREADSFSEDPRVVENRIQCRHGGMTGSDDPSRGMNVKQSEPFGENRNERCRIWQGASKGNSFTKNGCRDHLRQDSLGVKFSHRLCDIKIVGQYEQKGVTSRAFHAVTRRQRHADRRFSRPNDLFLHPTFVTSFLRLSNPF